MILKAATVLRCQLCLDTENRIELRRGSQAALRIKGGMFADVEQFPVVAAIQFSRVEDGTLVEINVLDDLGFGLKVGMKKKYTQAVQTLSNGLISALAAATLSLENYCGKCGVSRRGMARYCASCGSAFDN